MPTRQERLAERRAARVIPTTPLGMVTGALSLLGAAAAGLLTVGSLAQTMSTYSVRIQGGLLWVTLLTLVAAALLVGGGIGMLLRKSWGWWCVLAGALIGLGDLFRLYSGLLSRVDPNHPRVGEVWTTILTYAAFPAAVYAALLVLLTQRSQRITYRISPEPRSRRRDRGAAEPER